MSRFYPLTVDKVIRATRDAVVISFAVPVELQKNFHYVQGQHLSLRLALDGTDIRRSYSICSAVQDNELRIAVKHAPGGVFSAWANDSLQAGQLIEVMPPSGHFNVPLNVSNRKHYLAFAAGSGITPLLSIIKTTLYAEPHSRFTLLYGNRASSTVIFKEELEDLKDRYLERFQLVFVMSREQQDIELFNGRINKQKCAEFFKHWLKLENIDTVFICGPASMMNEVAEALQEHGMDKARIKIELFAASIPTQEHKIETRPVVGQHECEVHFVLDGRERSFILEKNKESILDAGLRQGFDLPYSCKGGVCSTCRAKLLSGEVDMDVNFALEDYEVARGYILTCQSYPVTDKVSLSYDQADL